MSESVTRQVVRGFQGPVSHALRFDELLGQVRTEVRVQDIRGGLFECTLVRDLIWWEVMNP